MILYPTETVYGLGTNALNPEALRRLYSLKGRTPEKSVSWLVRSVEDIERFAIVNDQARNLIARHLPGPLTIVLPVREEFRSPDIAPHGTVGFRISSDPVAQKVVHAFMETHNAPLTCTSANVSGMPTPSDVDAIRAQFGERAHMIEEIVDDGPRAGAPSTVIEIIGETIRVLREGAISARSLFSQ